MHDERTSAIQPRKPVLAKSRPRDPATRRACPGPTEGGMSAHQRERVLQLLMSRRGEWVPAAEVAEAGGLQYGARFSS